MASLVLLNVPLILFDEIKEWGDHDGSIPTMRPLSYSGVHTPATHLPSGDETKELPN
jgi:hypothetical protein